MTGKALITLAVLIALAGCARVSESRLNPLNWFGRGHKVETVVVEPSASIDPRNLVAQVATLRVEQVPGGAIVRATGVAERQGYFDAQLLPVGGEVAVKGVLTYYFKVSPPITQTRVGTARSREIVVGRFVSNQTLQGVKQIRVNARTNALAARR
jgi:hypothetical protein